MKLKFFPQNVETQIQPNKTVLEISREQGLNIQSSCNGMCNCGDCRVFVKEGENNLLLPTAKELKLIGPGYYIDQRRLACQLYCFGDVVIDLTEQEKYTQAGLSPQFLKRTQKKSPQEARSKNDILIKDDKDIQSIKEDSAQK